MQLNRCPNCTGQLELSKDRKKKVCPYCGSEFSLEKNEIEEAKEEESLINKDWFIFDWNEDVVSDLMDYQNFSTSFKSFLSCLNDYDSSEEVEKYMRTYLLNTDDVSAPGINEERMSGIKARIAANLTPGEHIVLYYDDAIFMHGKTGTVITNKKTLFIEKKKITEVQHETIHSLYFGYSLGLSEIKIGGKYDNNLLGTQPSIQGAASALICFYSFELNPNRPKIHLTSN